jgi:hypothetical protein
MSRNPVILSVIHHRQVILESASYFVLQRGKGINSSKWNSNYSSNYERQYYSSDKSSHLSDASLRAPVQCWLLVHSCVSPVTL